MPDTRSKKRITTGFIKELENFKLGGYGFLFEGTQREAFDAYLDGLKNSHQEGYLEIPTGVGKTSLFIAVIGCYLKATQNIPDAPKVLIHEPSNDLVMQTALAFADFMPAIAKTIETEDDRGRVMDFDNSDVELHYSKRKGAANGHKVLITTYQSQAADERKGEDRPRTFKAEDFGLVIHDEAHYLTGPKYGPAAVDKFKGAIQLGVTATPEYSDDKAVANKLAHRYYHLPLNTAIERGDLCHVRPILIKTNLKGKDRINLERARKFLEERHGKPLSGAQLEQLLNQKTRNQSIIKAYLTGKHPDTDERFLGQTGMIFAGGITHCDDFIRNTQDVLIQPRYRPIKRWLAEEGLALIAPIHSAIPKDGIDITIGGEKRKCTKDEIKELHRQGKILLIISDQELKLGTDFPKDSFIAETVDRFSVPDATQRMGRGFRVDRGNPRYSLPPNPEKSCVAANVIDETTHEMYKGTPHYPIHAIEILHGAVHRPPMRRQGAMTTRKFRQNPPEVSESVEQLGFELISRVESLQAITKQFEEGRKKKLPEKTDQWLTRKDVENLPGGTRNALQDAVDAILAAYDETKPVEQIIRHNGQSIRVQKLQSGARQAICIFRDDWPKVELAAGVTPGGLLEKTDKWFARYDISGLTGGNRKVVKDTVTAILAAYDETKPVEQTISHNGQSIRVQKMRSGSQQSICIFHQDWPKVMQAAEAETAFAREDLKSSPISKKDITSGGEHLKRKGRERGASDG